MRFPEANLIVVHFDEPELDFYHDQRSHHPKDGLYLYGPHDGPRKPREIRIGVVGTLDGIGHFRSWSRRLLSGIPVPPPGPTEKKDRLHLADFAGLEETFGVTFDPDRLRVLTVEFGECPIFCVWLNWSMLAERSKDDDDFQRTAGRTFEGLCAA